MLENEITYTLIMVFKDAAGSIRSIKVPGARANVTGREVRKVMEQIVRDGVFLSRNGLPLVKLVRAVLVKVRWIFVAAKFTRGPVSVESTSKSDVPTGCPTAISVLQGRGPAGDPCIVQTTGKSGVPTGCPTTSDTSCMLVPSYGISDELFAKANAPCLRPVGADGNNSCPPDKKVSREPQLQLRAHRLCRGWERTRLRVGGALPPSTQFPNNIIMFPYQRVKGAFKESHLSPLDSKWKCGGDVIRGKAVYDQKTAA